MINAQKPEKFKVMAKENMNKEEVEEKVKPTEKSSEENPNEASEKSEASQLPDQKDIDDVLMILNEVDQTFLGGKGGITAIPDELHGSIKFLVEKMITIRDAFDDPLFKDILDDLLDQRQEGKTPSMLVAIARNVPMEELQNIADEEGYEDVQNAVSDRVAKEKEDKESEDKLYANFDESKKNIEDYASEMGYDEGRKQVLYKRIGKLRNIFADGLITKEEAGEIDKIDNYDSDMEMMKSKLPEKPVKTVLPDKASMDSQMTEAKQTLKQPPRNSLESMAQMNTGVDVTEIGKRKRKAF